MKEEEEGRWEALAKLACFHNSHVYDVLKSVYPEDPLRTLLVETQDRPGLMVRFLAAERDLHKATANLYSARIALLEERVRILTNPPKEDASSSVDFEHEKS